MAMPFYNREFCIRVGDKEIRGTGMIEFSDPVEYMDMDIPRTAMSAVVKLDRPITVKIKKPNWFVRRFRFKQWRNRLEKSLGLYRVD